MSALNDGPWLGDELHEEFNAYTPLRCPGRGGLVVARSGRTGAQVQMRWLPDGVGVDEAISRLQSLALPCAPRLRGSGGDAGLVKWMSCDWKELAPLQPGVPSPGHLLAELADFLDAVHHAGLVHGSLTPRSVMTGEHQTVVIDAWWVLLDALTDRRPEWRELTLLPDTAPFLSPERARGEAATPASDIYALGAMICFAQGDWVPPRGNALLTLNQVRRGELRPDASGLDARVRPWVEQMISMEPLERPTAAELVANHHTFEDPFARVVRVWGEEDEDTAAAPELPATVGWGGPRAASNVMAW